MWSGADKALSVSDRVLDHARQVLGAAVRSGRPAEVVEARRHLRRCEIKDARIGREYRRVVRLECAARGGRR